jgi:hypothetical protein
MLIPDDRLPIKKLFESGSRNGDGRCLSGSPKLGGMLKAKLSHTSSLLLLVRVDMIIESRIVPQQHQPYMVTLLKYLDTPSKTDHPGYTSFVG